MLPSTQDQKKPETGWGWDGHATWTSKYLPVGNLTKNSRLSKLFFSQDTCLHNFASSAIWADGKSESNGARLGETIREVTTRSLLWPRCEWRRNFPIASPPSPNKRAPGSHQVKIMESSSTWPRDDSTKVNQIKPLCDVSWRTKVWLPRAMCKLTALGYNYNMHIIWKGHM